MSREDILPIFCNNLFMEHKKSVQALCTYPDPSLNLAVTGGCDKQIMFWDVNTSKLHFKMKQESIIIWLEFSADGNYLAISDLAGILHVRRVWRSESGLSKEIFKKPFRTFSANSGFIQWQWHPSGMVIFGRVVDGKIYLCSLLTGDMEVIAGENESGSVSFMSLTDDCSRIATGYDNGYVRLWRWLPKTEMLFESKMENIHTGPISAIVIHPSESIIMSCDYFGTMKFFNENGFQRSFDSKDLVTSVAISPGKLSKIGASGTYNGVLMFWDLENFNMIHHRNPFLLNTPINRMLWLSDEILFACNEVGSLLGIDSSSGSCIFSLDVINIPITSFCYNAKLNIFAISCCDREVQVFNLNNANKIQKPIKRLPKLFYLSQSF